MNVNKLVCLCFCLLLTGLSVQESPAQTHVCSTVNATAKPTPKPKPSAKPSAKPTSKPATKPAPLVQTSPQPVKLPRLMLVPVENRLKDQSSAISEAALEGLQRHLLNAQTRPFQLLGRRYVQAQLKELAFSESALSDPETSLTLGRILSANQMLSGVVASGQIHTSGTTNLQPIDYTWASVKLSATLIDIETGEVLYSGTASGISERRPNWQGSSFTSLIVEAVEQAVPQLAADLLKNRSARRLP